MKRSASFPEPSEAGGAALCVRRSFRTRHGTDADSRREKWVAMPRTSRNARAVRRFLHITFLLLLLTAGIGGRYLYNRGVTRSWREWVVEEMRKQGVEVSFARLTVRPFRGLVAKDVKFFDGPARTHVVAQMNEMVVEANYANAVKGKQFLDALTLVDTNLRIPLDPDDPFGAWLGVDKLNARILFPPNQIHLARLEATVLGVRVLASGSLVIPPGFTLSRDQGGAKADFWASILRELGTLRFEGSQPAMNVHFSGDLSRPGEILVEADLIAEKIRRGAYTLASLTVGASWQNDMVVLSRFDAADAKGLLQASGNFEPKSRTGELRIRSGLDLAALLREMNVSYAKELVLRSAPQMDLTARIGAPAPGASSPQFHVLGHVRLGKFTFGDVPFDGMYGDVSWDGRRWAVRDFVMRQAGGGTLTGNAQQDYDEAGAGDFRLGLDSNISPETLAPLFGPETRAKIAQVKFHEPPRITLSARGSAPGLDTLSAAGDVKLGRTTYQGGDTSSAEVSFRYNGSVMSSDVKLGRTTIRGIDASNLESTFRYDGRETSGALKLGRTIYRGVEARNAEATFRFDGRLLSLDTFEVNRAEGSGKGSLRVDLKTGLYHIKGVKTSVHPAEVALWIDPDLVQDIKPYRFGKKPPLLRIDGTLDPRKGGTQTKLTVIADAPGGMDYTFCKKDLHFDMLKGNLFFTDERLKLTDVRGELFGGSIGAEGDISILKAKPGHTATIRLAGVDFAKIAKLYFGVDETAGKLDGSCIFSGKGDEARAIRGEGDVSVTEGNVFAIPFLGPLSEILSKVVPGTGYSRARKATATFSMADGIITNKDLVIAGNGFSMYGNGRIWMVEDKIDYDIRINARGLPGVILSPISKLLEYRANSRFTKPDWRPKALPRLSGEKAP